MRAKIASTVCLGNIHMIYQELQFTTEDGKELRFDYPQEIDSFAEIYEQNFYYQPPNKIEALAAATYFYLTYMNFQPDSTSFFLWARTLSQREWDRIYPGKRGYVWEI